jgi:flagellar basal-body rod protein FlgG
MNDALYVAATGLFAHQSNVETIANNVANLNTPTYKKSKVSFQDMIYREAAKGERTQPLETTDYRGTGVLATVVGKDFAQGDVKATGSSLDLAIQGSGFIEVVLADGSAAYSRGGTLHVGDDGVLGLADGHALKSAISIPADAKAISISAAGEVTATTASGKQESVGTLDMVLFSAPQDLVPIGDNLYRASDASGTPISASATEDGAGQFVQGSLEMSNVSMVDEMVALMVAQRAYEMSAKVLQAADDMSALSNNLSRS